MRFCADPCAFLFCIVFSMPFGTSFFEVWRPTWTRKASILRVQDREISIRSRSLLGYTRKVQKLHHSQAKTSFLHSCDLRKKKKNQQKSIPKRFKNRYPLAKALGTPKIMIFMLKTSIFGSPKILDFFENRVRRGDPVKGPPSFLLRSYFFCDFFGIQHDFGTDFRPIFAFWAFIFGLG